MHNLRNRLLIAAFAATCLGGMVTACGEEPDSVSSAGPDASVVDGTARWREVLNERVDTEQSAFDPQREYAQVLTDFEVVELNDVAAWSTVVVRGITGAVERVGASPAPTGLPVEQVEAPIRLPLR